MKCLLSRAICHPIIALYVFYLAEIMHHVDYNVSGALLVVAARVLSRVVSAFNRD